RASLGAWEHTLEEHQQLGVAVELDRSTQGGRHRVLAPPHELFEELLRGPGGAVCAAVLARNCNVPVVDGDDPALGLAAVGQLELDAALRLLEQRLVAAASEVFEEVVCFPRHWCPPRVVRSRTSGYSGRGDCGARLENFTPAG